MEKTISLHVLWAFLADNVVSIYVFEFMPVYKLVRHYLKGGGYMVGEERRGEEGESGYCAPALHH